MSKAFKDEGNMLRRFAILCGGDYQSAILLNHLYYERRTLTLGMPELAEELCIPEDNLVNYIISLDDGYGLISYGYDNNPDTIGLEITSVTPNMRTIEARLSQIPIEEEKVKKQNRRAIELNNPGTLTIAQWIGLLNHFDWECAYCGGDYEVLEHVIPLTFPSSGTTRWNCVPACHQCNSLKGPYHPDRLPQKISNKIGESLKRVQGCLDRWKEHSQRRQQERSERAGVRSC